MRDLGPGFRWLVTVILLALAPAVRGAPAIAQTTAEPTVFDKLNTFQSILRLVRTNYVDEVNAPKLIDGAIAGLLRELDPHSDYIDPERFRATNERNQGEYHGIGISFAIRDGYLTVISPIEGSPSERLGIRAGDRIVKIDSTSAVGIAESEVFEKLRGPSGSRVQVTVRRPGREELLEFEIVRARIPIKSIPYWFMLDERTGYVRLIRFSATTGTELEEALDGLEQTGMEQLIVDLRQNAGGYLEQAIQVVDKFIDADQLIVYTKGRIPGASEEHHATGGATHPRYPLVVLIDHGSASASEIVSGAVQDWDRGLVVGQTSFGKGLVQRQYRLPDGSALFLTVARYYTPSGRLIQRPYEQGGDKLGYYAEAYDDIEPGAETDSTAGGRPVHYTAGGRRVFGGGGITPDVRADPVELTDAQQLLEQSNLFFEVANTWVGEQNFTAPDLESFRTGFRMNEGLWQRFLERAETRELPLDHAQLGVERAYIEQALKREMAGNLWGLRARFRIDIDSDSTVASAMGLFEEAAALLHMHHAADQGQR